jgi:hypothetical protein
VGSSTGLSSRTRAYHPCTSDGSGCPGLDGRSRTDRARTSVYLGRGVGLHDYHFLVSDQHRVSLLPLALQLVELLSSVAADGD